MNNHGSLFCNLKISKCTHEMVAMEKSSLAEFQETGKVSSSCNPCVVKELDTD